MISEKTNFKRTIIGLIPEEWEIQEFSNILDTASLRNGLTKPTDIRGTGVKMVNMGELFTYDRIENAEMDRVPLSESERKTFLLQKGDLLFARQSLLLSGVGKCSIFLDDAEDVTFEGHIIRARIDKTKANSVFFYYFFQSRMGRKIIEGYAEQVAAAGIRGSDLKRIPVVLPPIPEQKAIANFLFNLDCKIENNLRMNKTLESIGQSVFRRWFVDFEFPNQEGKPYKSSGGKMVNSLFGKIPASWCSSKVGEVLQTVLGGTPKRAMKEYWKNGDVPWINSGKINEFRIIEPTEFITRKGLENSAAKIMPKRTTVLAVTGATLGQVSLLEIEACGTQNVIGILGSRKVPSEYIYYWTKYMIKDITASQTGGAQQHINKEIVNNSVILIPDEKTMNKFLQLIQPFLERISVNCFETKALSQIRDILLPRLMSGKIRVPIDNKTERQ